METNGPADQAFADLLKAASGHEVDFVVVGAHALASHGYPRFTGDLGILIRPTIENGDKLMAALLSVSFPTSFTAEDLANPETICHIGRYPWSYLYSGVQLGSNL